MASVNELPRLADIPPNDRPRERLIRLGSGALSDAELVAVMLGTGRPGINVVALAQSVLAEFGGVSKVLRLQVEDLISVRGVGHAMAARFVSAAELCRRSAAHVPPGAVRTSADLAPVAVAQLADLSCERLLMFGLSPDGSLRNPVVLASGTGVNVAAPVSSILRAVLASGCSKFALAHNHPSGVLEASKADVDYTGRVAAAARQCGLQLIDHLVVAGSRWKSIL